MDGMAWEHQKGSSENHPGHNDKQWLQWLQCIVVIVTIVWHCNLGGWHPRGMGIAAWTPERGCWAHYNYDTMKKHWKDYQFLKLCFHFLALFSLSNIVFNALISIVTIVNHLTHYLPFHVLLHIVCICIHCFCIFIMHLDHVIILFLTLFILFVLSVLFGIVCIVWHLRYLCSLW